jgi:uncharacterized protein YdeI (YjbR/CyaY-like superfamily)
MAPKPAPPDLPTHSFASARDLEAFLEREHLSLPGFHLKLAKKASGIASVTGAEAVEAALCFGWIDGRAGAVDHDWWSVRYTPRRPRSLWSLKNAQTVARLEQEGRMRPAGRAAVEAAKRDGRWERAYAGPATIEVQDDLKEALRRNEKARRFFEGLNSAGRYAVLWRVQTASPAARAKRIEALVRTLEEGKRPGDPVGKTDAKTAKKTNAKTNAKTGKTAAVRKTAKKKDATERRGESVTTSMQQEEEPPKQISETGQSRREGLRRRG